MIKLMLVVVLMWGGVAVAAQRDEKVRTLIDLWGLLDAIEQQKAAVQRQLETTVQNSVRDNLKSFDLNPAFQARVDALTREFLEKATQSAFSGEAYVAELTTLFGPAFSDQELDQLIAFYSSPLGRRELAVTKEAVPKAIAVASQQGAEQLLSERKAFSDALRATLIECNCARK
ncbi:DUF2059 domain-containing protein [Nevskia sp.]|uniref:DUF2059 domain-containing protein n=1 Tax=Nevskia sp. TaxID=1929292 RepID=UPI0025D9C8F6|nr:DUF2059 domain-containing protein [Nevskia sp.]